MDPRARQRVETFHVRPSVRADVTNVALLEGFQRAVAGKLSRKTIESYSASIRDAIKYNITPDGNEVSVRSWTKERVWEYVQYVEANYCASFHIAPFHSDAALCKQRVWVGTKPTTAAVRDHCAPCLVFKRPTIQHRLNALNKWFKYLARVGAVPTNIIADIVSEHYEETPRTSDLQERRRNPSVPEMLRLVNETVHPMRRAFYAASAKWWMRPNEMLMLTRYESFGITPPEGLASGGFENGHRKYAELVPFTEGGDLVYLPETKGSLDKRKGNRWAVVDSELRPIIEQYFSWWERVVQRDTNGVPTTSALWLNENGRPLQQRRMYNSLFHDDTLRLGLVTQEEQRDPRLAWTAHCQRHFGEKLLELHNTPDVWCNHFRGDKLHDARGHYYKPTPQQVREKYHELVPRIGFKPLPDVPRLRRILTETETHVAALQHEIERVEKLDQTHVGAASVLIDGLGRVVRAPRRLAPAFLAAYRRESPGATLAVRDDPAGRGSEYPRIIYLGMLRQALDLLSGS